jgi:energy-converting hydrogenase B subunit D
MTLELLFDVVLGLMLVWLAWRVLSAPDLFKAVVLFIVFGLLMALAWARLDAPDIALAEAAIGAGLTGALLLDAVGQMARSSTDRDRTQSNDGEGVGDGEP